MINILIISHAEIANSFAYCIEHIINKRVENLVVLPVKKAESTESILARAQEIVKMQLLNAEGVLILTDVFGATPSNIASKLIKSGKVELITGLNLPMLIRAISYSKGTLADCVSKSVDGGVNGIVHISESR